jgi:hypothetical protein
MSNRYLDSTETIILTTPGVRFNAVLYDMMLTTRRLILVDSTYARFEPQTIPFFTILSVTAGKVATGEPVITLSLTGTDSDIEPQQMNLIFTQHPGEQRRRERDEWLRNLMGQVVAARQPALHTETPPAPASVTGLRPAGATPRPIEMAVPRKLVIETPSEEDEPVILPDQPEIMVVPEEEPESFPAATRAVPDAGELPAAPKKEPESAETAPPAPQFAKETGQQLLREMPPSADDKKPEPPDMTTPAAGAAGGPAAPAEQTPGSLDLFSAAALAVQGLAAASFEKTGSQETAPVPASPAAEALTADGKEEPDGAVAAPPGAMEGAQEPSGEAPPQIPPPPPPRPAPRSVRHTVIAASVIIVVILALACGTYLLLHPVPQKNAEPPAPVVTFIPTIETIVPTPSAKPTETGAGVVIPKDGVWVRVTYNGTFVGWVGNPGFLQNVRGSNDQFYKILKSTSLVQVSFQKQDYSGEVLAVEVYRNGELIERRTVRAPMGEIAFILNPKTSNPIGVFPTVTASA